MPDAVTNSGNQFVGILLAAGKGSRFDPTGAKNKLLQPLPSGDIVVRAAATNLRAAVPTVVAVVRPGTNELASQLRSLGCEVTECPTAGQGMAESLVHALSVARDAAGWVVALGDMPYVQPATITALIGAIEAGADIAVPTIQGQRGNPVAFSTRHLARLLELQGDQGARSLLKAFPVVEVPVGDIGIVRDIDAAADLARPV
jgi:molybdenum cofactor cytidylyltransferase